MKYVLKIFITIVLAVFFIACEDDTVDNNNIGTQVQCNQDDWIQVVGECVDDIRQITWTKDVECFGDAPENKTVVCESTPTVNKKDVGINVGGLTDWTPSLNFLNQFRRARAWISQPKEASTWDDERAINLDENGYVTSLEDDQAVLTLIYANASTESGFSCENGRYEVHYEGEGTFTFRGSATLISHDEATKTAIAEFDCTSSDYIAFRINSTNPNNYLKNLTLVHESHVDSFNSGEIFHPRLLAGLKDFSLIRFMDWGKTNSSKVTSWQNRPTPQNFSYSLADKGVSVEAMIDLANRLNISPWICVPHLVNDKYFTQLATLLKNRLDPNLKFYVEYSNEVWNGIFPQEDYAIEQGMALGLDPSNQWVAGQLFHWSQTSKIGEALHIAFADEQTQRYVTAVGSQNANDWFARQGYEYLQSINRQQFIDAVAIAPYMGGPLGSSDTASTVSSYTVDQLLDAVEADITDVMNNAQKYVTYFSPLNINIIGYEGCQHLARVNSTASDEALQDLFVEANRADRMGDIYKTYLDRWTEVTNGQVMSLFLSVGGYGRYGSWGLKENDTQNPAPKHDAVIDWIYTLR